MFRHQQRFISFTTLQGFQVSRCFKLFLIKKQIEVGNFMQV